MKKQKTRQMTGDEESVELKNKDVPHGTISKKKKLRCVRGTDMPGTGLFKGGDIVEDADTIDKIGDNPHFETFEEEQS